MSKTSHCLPTVLEVALLFGGVLLSSCSESGAPSTPRRLLLVTLDTTRADHLGAYGKRPSVTPVMDGLAQRGVVYEEAYAPTPVTLPSHTSILTGMPPSAHGVRDNGLFRLAEEATLLSEVLAERDFRTAAFVGAFVLDGKFGLDQGFERYGGPQAEALAGPAAYVLERRAGDVVAEAGAWLDTVQADEDFFLWVHFFDPHRPYDPPEPQRSAIADAYTAEIAACDAALGDLLQGLEDRGLSEGLVTMVTADHGEGLGEHGEDTHGVFLYQGTVHVPLIVSGGGVREGVRVSRPVTVASIPPSVLDLWSLPEESMPEVQLPPLPGLLGAAEDPSTDQPIYLESFAPWFSHRWHPMRAVVQDGSKLIQGRERELYDYRGDPAEARDLAETQTNLVEELTAALQELLATHAPMPWTEARAMDEGDLEQLRALGYLTGSAEADPFADPKLLAQAGDARERIGDLASLWRCKVLLGQVQALGGRRNDPAAEQQRQAQRTRFLNEAGALLEGIRSEHPSDPQLLDFLGSLASMEGRYADAVPLLEQAIQVLPPTSSLHFNLAVAYHATGDTAKGVRQMQIAVRMDPATRQGGYPWLATRAIDAEDYGRAVYWARKVAALYLAGSTQGDAAQQWLQGLDQERQKRGQVVPTDAEVGGR